MARQLILTVVILLEILSVNSRSDWRVFLMSSLAMLLVLGVARIKILFTSNFLLPVFIAIGLLEFIMGLIGDFEILYNGVVFNNWLQTYVQLPLIAVILSDLKRDSRIFQVLLVGTTILLAIALKSGFIPDYKYQIVGNLAVFGFIFVFESKHRLRLTYMSFCILIILLIGSRQSLIALLLILFVRFPKMFFAGMLSLIVLLKLPSNYDFGPFNTLQRLFISSSISSDSNDYRLQALEYYYENSRLLPNGYSYLYNSSVLEPHNIFVEILYSRGVLLGGIIIALLSYVVVKILLNKSENINRLLLIFGLVPAMVSFGIHASRFFLIAIFLHKLKSKE